MLRRLAYHSIATGTVGYQDAVEIASEARRNNALNAICGLLIFRDGRFFQVVEGHADAIGELYEKLRADPRHRDLELLCDEPIAAPAFHGFAMPLFGEQDGARLLHRLGEEAVPPEIIALIGQYATGETGWEDGGG